MVKKYFGSSIVFSIIGLFLGGAIGAYYNPGWQGFFEALFIVAILSVLEISISFDNAVVNATVLKDMSPIWQHRFLTWGMLIAVFGMRLIFPLLIVGIVAHLNPLEALILAAFEPSRYAQIMLSAHHEVSAFGATFLMLVALHYFFDEAKEIHWLKWVEKPLVKAGRLEAIEVGLVLLVLVIMSRQVPSEEGLKIITSGILGILTFLSVEAISTFLKKHGGSKSATPTTEVVRSSAALFVYLEVLDASFSFDGVIGAFAITNNLFVIAIGLSIGALFVRSMTIYMVDRGTLQSIKYLEHGAFYAVASLAIIMFLSLIIEISEVITGLIGAIFIGLSIWSSKKPIQ